LPDSLKPASVQSPPGFARRAAELRSELLTVPVALLAARTATVYGAGENGSGEFQLALFGSEVRCSYPDFNFSSAAGVALAEFQQLLLLYYFASADGTALSGRWVSFADLRGGRMYARAFQGYSGDEIVKAFGEDLPAFRSACEQVHGQAEPGVGDAAYTFQALPRVSARFVYWQGDEDFPSSCKILFDAAATCYVPIDACAIIGSTLARKIIKNASVKPV
jgi:hypothetical protein